MNYPNRKPALNSSLTQKVIELHDQGYDCDFFLMNGTILLCMQNNRKYPMREVQMHAVKKVYDDLTQSYKHIHTIETDSGEKGVFLADLVYN